MATDGSGVPRTFHQIGTRQLTIYATELQELFLNERRLCQDLEKQNQLMEQHAQNITVLNQALQESFKRFQRGIEGTIDAMLRIVQAGDPYTFGHQQRVTWLACAIAREMGLPKEQIERTRMAAALHDIGKLGVPIEILSKASRLTESEFAMIKAHPQVGYSILRATEFLSPLAQIVLQHHERMDGSGYPSGLWGEDILLEARIIGVADVVEAMASHRPYRPPIGVDKALEEISQRRGVLYDPEVVDACLRLFVEKGFSFEKETEATTLCHS